MRLKTFLLSLLASGMALFLLLHFGLIWVYGRVQIFESNIWILLLETIMVVGTLGFSLFCTIEQLKRPK